MLHRCTTRRALSDGHFSTSSFLMRPVVTGADKAIKMLDTTHEVTESDALKLSMAQIDDANELAWQLRDFGLMFDPEFADEVRRGCAGNGEHSRLLRAIVGDPDEPETEPFVTSGPVGPPMPAAAYRGHPISRRELMKANPFIRPKAVELALSPAQLQKKRSAVLTDEVAQLYNCLAFAMREYGVVMNGHMTIAWELLGVRDHRKAVKVLTEFNARAANWLGVDATGRRRKNVRSGTWGGSESYCYAYVHEHASTQGFHVHQLLSVGDGKAKAFAEWAVLCLATLAGATSAPAEAVVFTPGTKRDGFAPYLPRFKKNELERGWVWFRYLAKNLSPHEFKQVGEQCARQREIFRIRPLFIEPQPVACTKLFGCSQSISAGAQRRAGFVSKFDRGDWSALYSGSELEEYRRWSRQREQQQEVEAVLGGLNI